MEVGLGNHKKVPQFPATSQNVVTLRNYKSRAWCGGTVGLLNCGFRPSRSRRFRRQTRNDAHSDHGPTSHSSGKLLNAVSTREWRRDAAAVLRRFKVDLIKSFVLRPDVFEDHGLFPPHRRNVKPTRQKCCPTTFPLCPHTPRPAQAQLADAGFVRPKLRVNRMDCLR